LFVVLNVESGHDTPGSLIITAPGHMADDLRRDDEQ
jgi:hypothetical protein